ncbi:MAG: hypothetical protein ACKVIH_08195 [Burkholderiales bacterium]
MQNVLSFLLRLLLLLTGLVVAASIALAALLLLVFWGLRVLWAKLSGQPVTPFVMRFDPRAGFEHVFRGRQGERAVPERNVPAAQRDRLTDVTDVQAKPPRS